MAKQEKVWRFVQRMFARQRIDLDQWSEKDCLTWLGELSQADAESVVLLIEQNMQVYRDQQSSYSMAKRIFPKKDAVPDCLTARLIEQVRSKGKFEKIKKQVVEEETGASAGLSDKAILAMSDDQVMQHAWDNAFTYDWLWWLVERDKIEAFVAKEGEGIIGRNEIDKVILPWGAQAAKYQHMQQRIERLKKARGVKQEVSR